MGYTVKLGREATITIGANELKLARDVTVELGGSEQDVTCRDSGGVAMYVLANRQITITGTAIYDSSNAAITALLDSWKSGTPLTVTVSDPSHEYTGKWVCTSLSTPQPVDGVMTIDFTLKPTPSEST